MTDRGNLVEIDDQIAVIRENLRTLMEQAAAQSGAGDEDFADQRIAEQEAQLASLVKQRENLSKSNA